MVKNILVGIILTAMLTSCSSETANTQTTPKPTAQTQSTTQAPSTTQAQSAEQTTDNKQDTKQENKEENTVDIIIEMMDGGVIKAELYPDIAPITVANFEKLINENFFDGLIFHRVISGFMIQGGGYTENGEQKQADSIKGEFASNGVENDLKHERGVLSMARTSDKNSASSQFFIMHETSPHLDGDYAAFGRVTEGMDVVDKIASAQTDYQDVPIEPQVIKTIRLAE
jgi:peptidyl-prolyl cis-trans isomerase B (cyclophilin B)